MMQFFIKISMKNWLRHFLYPPFACKSIFSCFMYIPKQIEKITFFQSKWEYGFENSTSSSIVIAFRLSNIPTIDAMCIYCYIFIFIPVNDTHALYNFFLTKERTDNSIGFLAVSNYSEIKIRYFLYKRKLHNYVCVCVRFGLIITSHVP